MNKMEILKNTFEKIGYQTKIINNEEEIILVIVGVEDGDGNDYQFAFNAKYEPIIWKGGYSPNAKYVPIKEFYKYFNNNDDEE